MRIFLMIFLVICSFELEAQITAGRQTFSSGGSISSGTTINASSTLGEAITGTSSGTTIIATQGFQQVADTGMVSIETPLGDKFDIVVFPNPTVDHVTLQFTGVLDHPVDVQLFDANGRAVSGWNLSIRQPGETRMSTNELAKGTYFLRFTQKKSGTVHSMPIVRK